MNPDLLDIRPLMDARTLEAAREIARDPAVMGMNPANLGRSADAREALQEALGLLAGVDPGGEAATLLNLARAEAHLGETDRAELRADDALHRYLALGDPHGAAHAQLLLGTLHHRAGALQDALAETRAAAEARIDGGRLALACVLADLGRGEEAKQAAEGAPGRPELRRVYERLLEATTDAERRAARSALPMP